MATAEELSFKVTQAKKWKESVLTELELVDNLLESVSTEVQTAPYEEDTILKGMKAAGDALETSFKTLNKNFVTAVQGVDGIVSAWQNMINSLLDGLHQTVSKIGQK